jgi:hypothetical protein
MKSCRLVKAAVAGLKAGIYLSDCIYNSDHLMPLVHDVRVYIGSTSIALTK